MRPPVSGGRSVGRGPASERAMAINASRGSAPAGASRTGSGRTTSSIRTPSASTTTTAAGSPATNEYLPQRSERSTDSRIRPGPSPARAGKSPTGVETSARSSVQTGTMGQEVASASNSFRLGLICSCGSTCAPSPRCRSDRSWCRAATAAGNRKPRTVGPGLRGLAVRALDLRARRHEAPRALAPRPGHPVHPHQAPIVPAGQPHRQRRATPVPLSCGTHAPVTDVRAHAARRSGGRRDREPPPACSAAGSSAR